MLTKKKLTWLVVLGGLALMAALRCLKPAPYVPADPVMARAKGNPNAKVKIVEFIDFECPACAYGSKLLKENMEQHPQDIYLQVKYFPLTGMHHHAMPAALYSECAARQGKFWPLHELMMPQQGQWSQLLSADPVFLDMARAVGADMTVLQACVASEDANKAINDEKSLGQSMGVQSTPSYFINGKMVVGTKSLLDELDTYFPKGH